MIEKGGTYLVMGLLDADSIAYAIGKTIQEQGGHVIYTVQNERMKRIFLDSGRNNMPEAEKAAGSGFDLVEALEQEYRWVLGVLAEEGVHPVAGSPNPETER